MVKVRFTDIDKRVLPEMSAKVAFLERLVQKGEEKPRVTLPPSAVATRDGKKVVFVVSGDRVVQRPVTLGQRMGDMVEVLSGVKAGEKIAVKPLDKLHDQSRISTPEK